MALWDMNAMTVHKLNPAPATESLQPLLANIGINHDEYSLAHAIVKARSAQATRLSASSFPIYRQYRWAIRDKVVTVFDDFALRSGLVPQRMLAGDLFLEGQGIFVNLDGYQKAGYCSCMVEIWAESLPRADETRAGAEDHFHHEPAERGRPRRGIAAAGTLFRSRSHPRADGSGGRQVDFAHLRRPCRAREGRTGDGISGRHEARFGGHDLSGVWNPGPGTERSMISVARIG